MRIATASTREASALPQRWSQERRLEFIDFRLCWDGRLNRADLTEFFGISVPQASLDIARYEQLAPRNLVYDRSARVYVAGADFRALYASSSPQRYMEDLLGAASLAPSTSSLLGHCPPIVSLPNLQRSLDVRVVVALSRAMRDKLGQRIVYQSMSRAEPHARVISPHAFAHDGHRFHVRAFCHERGDFRDFVLGRILKIEGTTAAERDGSCDRAWHTYLELELAPHPKLPLAHRKVLALDYGMRDGQLTVPCRQAFVFYTLQHLRLSLSGPAALEPREYQIVLKNWRDIARALGNAADDE
jgi:hypothetical protein